MTLHVTVTSHGHMSYVTKNIVEGFRNNNIITHANSM